MCVRESLDTCPFGFLAFVRFAFFFFRALSGFVALTRGRGVSASGGVIKTNAPRKHMAEKRSERMMSIIDFVLFNYGEVAHVKDEWAICPATLKPELRNRTAIISD